MCIAGGLCLQLLQAQGISVGAHILSIGDAQDIPFDAVAPDLAAIPADKPPVLNTAAWPEMLAVIEGARKDGDSVGGVIECAVTGLPTGIGSPMFMGMENRIAAAVFAVPAVKGIAFGSGFDSAHMRGSQHNDPFVIEGGKVKTRTNYHGGILGGITSGMPLVFKVAIKPTPSIGMEQDSVSLSAKTNVKLRIHGRHDPCIVPRAVPCMEAAAAIALCDALMDSKQRLGE